ncbi:MAG: DNA-processing protein DprA [Rikenellaceae bacterium]
MDIFDLALAFTPRVGGRGAAHLIDTFGSTQRIFSASVGELVERAELSPAIAERIASRVAMPEAESEMAYCRRNDIQIIATTDVQYPQLLRQITDPPHVLFAKGELSTLNRSLVSVVGTRNCSPYGVRSCRQIIEQLANKIDDLVIVSGLALGIDAAAHRAALDLGVPTIAVLPNALPGVSPSSHLSLASAIIDSGGLLVTELRSTVKNVGKTFISRNRIIAGSSYATIVIESALTGGSMSTARMAVDLGRPVAAIPGRIGDSRSSGCNLLIGSSVAQLISSGDDLIKALGWEGRVGSGVVAGSTDTTFDESSHFTPDQLGLLRCFRNDEPLHISKLQDLSQMSIPQLSALLLELELMGAVSAPRGAYYERIIPLDAV